jgi:hypothetical protein
VRRRFLSEIAQVSEFSVAAAGGTGRIIASAERSADQVPCFSASRVPCALLCSGVQPVFGHTRRWHRRCQYPRPAIDAWRIPGGVRVVWFGVQLLLLLVREAEQCVARGL